MYMNVDKPKTSTKGGTSSDSSFSHLWVPLKCPLYKIRNLSLHILAGT
jgi:hypothetical protein